MYLQTHNWLPSDLVCKTIAGLWHQFVTETSLKTYGPKGELETACVQREFWPQVDKGHSFIISATVVWVEKKREEQENK